MSARPNAIEFDMPAHFVPLVSRSMYRNKVAVGGRARGASWSFARALIALSMKEPLRILCTREHQSSIRDSVHRLLSDQIEMLGLSSQFNIGKAEIESALGGMFIFKGLRYNIEEIKSTEGVDIVWVEEAEKCSAHSWQVLIPTIRKQNSEIWVNFNVDQEDDPTYQRFVAGPSRDDTMLIRSSYRDNPWFSDTLRAEMEYDRRVDPDAAAHIWDGAFRRSSKAEVFHSKWRVDRFDVQPEWQGPYQGVDWGFSVDPTTLVRCYVADNDDKTRTLYIARERYKVGVELDDLAQFFDTMEHARNYKMLADNARPETISKVRSEGFMIEAADKWAGSVEEGIAFLRSFKEIVIHESCVHTIQEAKHYKWKLDKLTGEPTTLVSDKHNHCWDAVRYALQKMIRRSKQSGRASVRSL